MGKSKRNITNWQQYNQALINHGSVTFWLDESAINTWHCTQHHGGRGRGFQFSDTAIETALMFKGIFKPSVRASVGFINSLFQLMKILLTAPDYSCTSKRAKTLETVADNEVLPVLLNPLKRQLRQVRRRCLRYQGLSQTIATKAREANDPTPFKYRILGTRTSSKRSCGCTQGRRIEAMEIDESLPFAPLVQDRDVSLQTTYQRQIESA